MNLLAWTLIALGAGGLATALELAARWHYRRAARRRAGMAPGGEGRPTLRADHRDLPGPDAPDSPRRRIWVLGECDCAGAGLLRESDLWLHHLQALLDEHTLSGYEVVNLSRGGRSNAQRLELWKPMPARSGDVLLLRPGFHEMLVCAAAPGPACPLTGDDYRLAGRMLAGWRRWARRWALPRLLGELLRKRRPISAAGPAVRTSVASRPCWNSCREAILLTVEELVADAESKGVQPAVMSFFPAYQLEMSEADRRRLGRLETPDCRLELLPVVEQFDLMDAAVERLVCQMGLPLLDLAPAFWQRPDRFGLYLDPLHLNTAGQQVLAETLFMELCRAGLLTLDSPASASGPDDSANQAAGCGRASCA